MNIPVVLENKKPTRAWDLYCPVVMVDSGYKIYLTNTIESPEEYNEACFILDNAKSHETIELVINTPGGMIDSATMLVAAIKRSKAKVVAHLTGTVASAGTIIALACNELSVDPYTSFMIHNYSGGMMGKGHEMKARQEFMDKELNTAFNSFYEGFLSPEEMESVIDGKDLWMGADEVVERWSAKLNADKPKTKRAKVKGE